jgi:hypothetical protein
MKISRRSIETLLDLVEIKLSSMAVSDREDARELAQLETCRNELLGLKAALRAARAAAQARPEEAEPVHA